MGCSGSRKRESEEEGIFMTKAYSKVKKVFKALHFGISGLY